MKQKTILFLGDSITDAHHNLNADHKGLGDGYVSVIAKRMEAEDNCIMNRGHDGFTVRGLLLMLEMDCLRFDPDVVTVLIGCNDVGIEKNTGRTLSDQKFGYHYERLIKELRSKTRARIICMGPFIFPKPEEYLLWIPQILEAEELEHQIAKKYGVEFIPLHETLNQAAEQEGAAAITIDGTHLTERGARITAQLWLDQYMGPDAVQEPLHGSTRRR